MGTWLEAALFHAQNFLLIKSFVLQLPDEAVSIKECKQTLLVHDLQEQVEFISTNFNDIIPTIKFFKKQNIAIQSSFNKIEDLFEQLKGIDAPISTKLTKKLILLWRVTQITTI